MLDFNIYFSVLPHRTLLYTCLYYCASTVWEKKTVESEKQIVFFALRISKAFLPVTCNQCYLKHKEENNVSLKKVLKKKNMSNNNGSISINLLIYMLFVLVTLLDVFN